MISFNNFRYLNPASADLARDLIGASVEQRSTFSSFCSAWMGFNGWMECLTDCATDAEMITAMTVDERLMDEFQRLMTDAEFFGLVQGFAVMWPVVNVRDASRKLGRDVFWRLSEVELREEVRRNAIRIQPVGWLPGNVPTWPQLLRTIYAVRCNLFHGSKSPRNIRDHELVAASDKILRLFIERSGCFEWHD